MRLPLKYNVQSLAQRKLRSALTAGGVALSIFMSVMMLALSKGLLSSTAGTGIPENIILLSKGSESLEVSAVETEYYNLLKGQSGIGRSKDGEPLLSPETYLYSNVTFPGISVEGKPRAVVRGVWPVAASVHRQFKLTEGDFPMRGFQAAVGQLAAVKLGVAEEALAIGKTVSFEGHDWTIVGRFAAPGTILDSEVWVNLDDAMVAARREDYSTIAMQAESAAGAQTLITNLSLRTDVRVDPKSEADYYSVLTKQLKPVQAVAIAMTVILIAGGLMAGMNTMFTSILGRSREMGVLLVLGYKRRAVLLSFILESILLCLVGGAIGVGAGTSLSGLPMKISMGAFRFKVDAQIIVLGLALAVVIGLLGALLPVLRVSRLRIVDALRAS
jgi:ABC-type antimicrobial peptide transport system permease subunit